MSMSYSIMKRSLEIELISAEGLKVDRKPVKKKKTFCVIKIDDKSRVSKLDELGGSNPIWKDKIEMEMSINGGVRFIVIEVFYRRSGGQQKSIGCAKIPVTDFMGGFAPQGHLNFLSYRLRNEYGDKCGIINVSIMVKPNGPKPSQADKTLDAFVREDARTNNQSPSTLVPVDYGECSSTSTIMNGQIWRARASSSMAGYGGRVVTGVPVWSAIQRPS